MNLKGMNAILGVLISLLQIIHSPILSCQLVKLLSSAAVLTQCGGHWLAQTALGWKHGCWRHIWGCFFFLIYLKGSERGRRQRSPINYLFFTATRAEARSLEPNSSLQQGNSVCSAFWAITCCLPESHEEKSGIRNGARIWTLGLWYSIWESQAAP